MYLFIHLASELRREKFTVCQYYNIYEIQGAP